jgi:hypothetical protein
MMKEVNSFAELPRADDPELELGDVYRVKGGVFDVGLIAADTVVTFDGRAWVPLNGFKTVQNETDGKKDDVNAGGGLVDDDMNADGMDDDAESDAQGTDELWTLGSNRIVPNMSVLGVDGGGGVADVNVPVAAERRLSNLKIHDIQAVDADADVVARWMPRDFVQWYVALVSLITGPSGYGGVDENVVPGSGKAYGGMGSLKSGSSESLKLTGGQFRPESGVLMRSEWASDMRVKVDRKLRKIARDLKNMLDDDSKRRSYVRRRCAGQCKKFGEADWLYCAKCGGRMEQVD